VPEPAFAIFENGHFFGVFGVILHERARGVSPALKNLILRFRHFLPHFTLLYFFVKTHSGNFHFQNLENRRISVLLEKKFVRRSNIFLYTTLPIPGKQAHFCVVFGGYLILRLFLGSKKTHFF